MAQRQGPQAVGGSLVAPDFIRSMGWSSEFRHSRREWVRGGACRVAGCPGWAMCSAPLKDTRPAEFPKGSQG